MRANLNVALLSALVLAMIVAGAPFASAAAPDGAAAGGRLLAGTAAMALATLHALGLQDGRRAAVRFLAATLAIAWLAEAAGLRFGWPFGADYAYHPAVRPTLPGGVPLFIPFAWFVLAGIPAVLLRSWKTTRPDGSVSVARRLSKAAVAAIGVMAFDLVLDPIAVSTGLWTWARPGAYYGIPWTNFAGWWAVAFAVFLVGDGWAGVGRGNGKEPPLRYDLAWTAALLALLVLVGLAAFRQVGSGDPMLWAVLLLMPLVLRWLRALRRRADGPFRG